MTQQLRDGEYAAKLIIRARLEADYYNKDRGTRRRSRLIQWQAQARVIKVLLTFSIGNY